MPFQQALEMPTRNSQETSGLLQANIQFVFLEVAEVDKELFKTAHLACMCLVVGECTYVDAGIIFPRVPEFLGFPGSVFLVCWLRGFLSSWFPGFTSSRVLGFKKHQNQQSKPRGVSVRK